MTDLAADYKALAEYRPTHKVRFVTAASLFDGHAVIGQWPGWVGAGARKALGWYVPYFNAYTFVLARANEYQADRASADLVGADVAAHALKRVNLAGPRHGPREQERHRDRGAHGVVLNRAVNAVQVVWYGGEVAR